MNTKNRRTQSAKSHERRDPVSRGRRQSDFRRLPQKWFSDGATMLHPIKGRTIYWLVNLVLYALLNMFVLRIRTGQWIQPEGPYNSGSLISELLWPLNIFNFPVYIIITALLTAMLCAIPMLIAQLYNLLHALPFVLAVLFLGHYPMLSLSLLVCCAAVSFEPMRFKSKFVSATLCLVPVVLYWILYSGENPEQDQLRWAALYAPWAMAIIICVAMFAVVLGIGHFLRYKPGVMMPIFALILAGSVGLFKFGIGLTERDFRTEVYSYSPTEAPEFQSQSILPLIEQELARRKQQRPYIDEELMRAQLRIDWRLAFRVAPSPEPTEKTDHSSPSDSPISNASRYATRFQQAKYEAVDHIEKFILTHPQDARLADALYYKALVIDLKVDQKVLAQNDTLRFYCDMPSVESEEIWQRLAEQFGDSAIGLAAQLKIAQLTAGSMPAQPLEPFKFNEATEILGRAREIAGRLIEKRQDSAKTESVWTTWLGTVFSPPPQTISDEKLIEIQQTIARLTGLIDNENRSGHFRHEQRLAEFVGLDKRQINYEKRLSELLINAPQPDPLTDNIKLAQARLIQEPQAKMTQLADLAGQYPDRDGGIEAMLELAKIKLKLAAQGERKETRDIIFTESRKLLQKIVELRPDSLAARQAEMLMLQNPPQD